MVDDKFRCYRDGDLLPPEQTSRGGIGDLLAEVAQLAEQYDPHAPTLLLPGSDDCHESEIQAAGRPRRRHGPVMVIAVLGLATLVAVSAFANRAVFERTVLPALPSTLKAENKLNKIGLNHGHAQPSISSPASIASAESGEKIVSRWPVDNQEQPKTALSSSNRSAAPPSVLESGTLLPIATELVGLPPAVAPPALTAASAPLVPAPLPPSPKPKRVHAVTMPSNGSQQTDTAAAATPRSATRAIALGAKPSAAAAPAVRNQPLSLVPDAQGSLAAWPRTGAVSDQLR